jgi:hypothetical protein
MKGSIHESAEPAAGGGAINKLPKGGYLTPARYNLLVALRDGTRLYNRPIMRKWFYVQRAGYTSLVNRQAPEWLRDVEYIVEVGASRFGTDKAEYVITEMGRAALQRHSG